MYHELNRHFAQQASTDKATSQPEQVAKPDFSPEYYSAYPEGVIIKKWKPHRFSQADRDVLITILSQHKGRIDIGIDGSSLPLLSDYAHDWRGVLMEAGWTILSPGISTIWKGGRIVDGADIDVGGWPNGTNPIEGDDTTRELVRALKSMGVNPRGRYLPTHGV